MEEEEPVIGDYLIEEEIGEGNWGEVRRARRKDDPTSEVAIKIIYKQRLERKTKGGLKRLYNEFGLVQSLRHRNIVEYRELLEGKEKAYLVMKLGGLGLDRICEEQPRRITAPFIKSITQQLLGCLVYLEGRLVSHHDIKLANVLVDQFDQVMLVDFGVAERYNEAIGAQSFFGTPAHQAPEIAGNVSGATFDGAKADIWAVGVCLYYLVTGGQYPFRADTVYLLLKSIEQDPVVIPANLDSHLHDFLSRMLEKDPDKRISAREALNHPWLTRPDLPIHKTSLFQKLCNAFR